MTRECEQFVFLCQSGHLWGRAPPPNGLMDVRSVWQQAPEVVFFFSIYNQRVSHVHRRPHALCERTSSLCRCAGESTYCCRALTCRKNIVIVLYECHSKAQILLLYHAYQNHRHYTVLSTH